MASETFFSYTRSDSAFALRLAKDLRNRGHNIWIDQLDIRGGKRWDIEIEKALHECDNIIVILSPNSVVSNNVLDEISYCIEEGKRVIPLMMAHCNIPFRIRRIQYIDFSQDYAEGLKSLDSLLTEEKKVKAPISNISEEIPQTEIVNIQQPTTVALKESIDISINTDLPADQPNLSETEVEITEKTSRPFTSIRKTGLAIVIGLLAVCTLIWILFLKENNNSEHTRELASDSAAYPTGNVNLTAVDSANYSPGENRDRGKKDKRTESSITEDEGNGRVEGSGKVDDDDKPLTKVEVESEYPGGHSEWMRYISKTARYPDQAVDREIQGTVVVQFIVDKGDNVRNVEAISGPKEGGLREEAVRVITKSGKWIPATQNGRPVSAYKKTAYCI